MHVHRSHSKRYYHLPRAVVTGGRTISSTASKKSAHGKAVARTVHRCQRHAMPKSKGHPLMLLQKSEREKPHSGKTKSQSTTKTPSSAYHFNAYLRGALVARRHRSVVAPSAASIRSSQGMSTPGFCAPTLGVSHDTVENFTSNSAGLTSCQPKHACLLQSWYGGNVS